MIQQLVASFVSTLVMVPVPFAGAVSSSPPSAGQVAVQTAGQVQTKSAATTAAPAAASVADSRAAAATPAAAKRAKRAIPPTSFRIAAYNVLGAHLTGPGSKRPRFGPGHVRVAQGIEKLEASAVSVVVLNEFENPAAQVFEADGDWTLHRATPNNVFRDGNVNGNAVAWRSDVWKLRKAREFTVPGRTVLHMPVVTLEHRATAARMTVIGIHNPTSPESAKRKARAIELAYVTALHQSNPQRPLFIAGDFNERDTGFCGMTGTSVLRASAGGSVGQPCSVPRHGPVDWIFGSTDVTFMDQVIDRSTLGSISDHPLLSAHAMLPARSVRR